MKFGPVKPAEAEGAAREALRLSPDDDRIRKNLEVTLSKLNKPT